MKVWLLQRSEPTPHDDENWRAFRTGIMAKLLSDAGHEVLWWTSDFSHFSHRHRYGKNIQVIVTQRYNIQYLETRGYKKNISFRRFMSHFDTARSFRHVARVEKELPDIIIASVPTAELAWEAIKYVKDKRIPVILDIRDLWPDHYAYIAPKWLQPLVAICLIPFKKFTSKVFTHADGIISLTEAMLDWSLSYAKRGRNQIDRVVSMAYAKIDTPDQLLQQEARLFWDNEGIVPQDTGIIASFVGSLGKSTDIDVVLKTAMILQKEGKNIKFVICGGGDESTQIKLKCKNIQNVIFAGSIGREKVDILLERSDIGILPYVNNKSYQMSISNKPGEYLYYGLSLACSLKRGAIVSLIDEFKCGFTYMNNPEILARELSTYIASTKKLESHKINAKCAFKERFNGFSVYNEMIQHLEKIALSHN